MPNYYGIISRVDKPRTLAELVAEGHEQLIIVGHLGKDPELRYRPNGKPIARATLAASWGKRGEPDNHTEWIPLSAWEKTSEFLMQFKKGDAVLVIGKPSVRTWNDKEYAEFTVWSVARPIWKLDNAGVGVSGGQRNTPPPSANLPDDPDIPF